MAQNEINPQLLQMTLRPIRRNLIVILLLFFSVFFSVAYLTHTAEKVWEASATLSLQESVDIDNDFLSYPSFLRQKYLVKNQVAILESRNLSYQVIEILKHSDYRDSLRILHKRPKKTNPLFAYFSRKKSTPIDTTKRQRLPDDVAARIFRGSSRVASGRDSDIIELKVRSSSPTEAALLANTWIDAYEEYKLGGGSQLSKTREFLEEKYKEYKGKLTRSEQLLADYQTRENVIALDHETENLVMQAVNFDALYNQTKTELESVENHLTLVREQIEATKKGLVENVTQLTSKNLEDLQNQLVTKESEKAAYEAQLIGAGYEIKNDERYRQMENRLHGIRAKIIEESKKLLSSDISTMNPLNLVTQLIELETNYNSLTVKAKAQKEIADEYSNKLSQLPEKGKKFARLKRDLELNSNIYQNLAEQLEEIKIREAGQLGNINVVDSAIPPSKPVFPRPMVNMFLACFFGGLLGLGYAYLKDFFSSVISNENDLKDLNVRVITRIPVSRNKVGWWNSRSFKDFAIRRAREIVPYFMPRLNSYSSLAEAYRSIRTLLYLENRKKPLKTVLLTSPGPSEGKTTTAANLAITLANLGVKTLLVDGDLRRPVLDYLFLGSRKKMGLMNYLNQEIAWRKALRETSTERLTLLPAGSGVSNVPELLKSNVLVKFIKEARKEFNIIIFDSPPIIPVNDAVIYATMLDSSILVAKAEKTTRYGMKQSIERLAGTRARILGSVLTGVNIHSMYGYGSYYSYYEGMKFDDKKKELINK